jgi:AcrR family transcriptional regulator
VPNRAPESAWAEDPPSRAGKLTRAGIVRAAVELADCEGLRALSIRRVAGRLGVRPMSLYTHIASKDQLLDVMTDEVVAELLVPEPLPEDWRDALAAVARYTHSTMRAHPWVLADFGRPIELGPNALRHAEQSNRAIAGLGLDADDARTVLWIVDDFTAGHAGRIAALKERTVRLPDVDLAEFPALAEVGATEAFERPTDETFEVGLEILLDGIERRFG